MTEWPNKQKTEGPNNCYITRPDIPSRHYTRSFFSLMVIFGPLVFYLLLRSKIFGRPVFIHLAGLMDPPLLKD